MNTKKTFFTLLKNAHVIAPEDLGVKDILVAGEKIAMIGEVFLYQQYMIAK